MTKRSLGLHTTLAELVKEVIDEVAFSELKSQEQKFLEEVDHDRISEYIEKLIGRQGDLRAILRLVCLQSQVRSVPSPMCLVQLGIPTVHIGWQRTAAKGIRALQAGDSARLRGPPSGHIPPPGVLWTFEAAAAGLQDILLSPQVSSGTCLLIVPILN